MSRLRAENQDNRETTTTRVYVDSVRVLKMLAEAQDMTLADYIDKLAMAAAEADAQRVLDVISQYRAMHKDHVDPKKRSGK